MRLFYLKVVFLAGLVIITYAFLVPSLVSMQDTAAVISGVILAVAVPVLVVSLVKLLFIKKGNK
ncbi:hypothetical protein [Lelliottia wanjuensis]|uniref:hypothetical protein n=1 Tax=Lelliottia wanjuensis TaxID=3050585 RepID=UPI00254A17AC|nr:hypothetical protein [Lelliottia sp. V104_15]MDK9607074.1 hypothetical protein [Lelliottia sp. V104_15]